MYSKWLGLCFFVSPWVQKSSCLMPVGFQSRSYEPEDNSSARTEPQTLSRDSWLLYCSAFSLHLMETGELLNTLFPSAWVKPLNNNIRFLKQKHKKNPIRFKMSLFSKNQRAVSHHYLLFSLHRCMFVMFWHHICKCHPVILDSALLIWTPPRWVFESYRIWMRGGALTVHMDVRHKQTPAN